MKKLHLGCGKSPMDGWINLDQTAHAGVDVVFDLDRCDAYRLPFEDDSISEFYGSHVIEHITKTLPLMQELHRVAKPDARLLFKCPYGSSDDAFENPTHVKQYFLHSSGYWSQPFYWRESYAYTGDWATERTVLLVPHAIAGAKDSQALMNDVMQKRNVVRELHMYLRAVKPIREARKELQIPPKVEICLI